VTVTRRFILALTTALALTFLLPTGPTGLTSTLVLTPASSTVSESISTTISFTGQNLIALPLDGHGNPVVNANIAVSQVCTEISNRGGRCIQSHNSYTVENTIPDQLIAWINITRTSTVAVQSLRLNETLPQDWIVNPPWVAGGSAGIQVYYANTTRISTDPGITQPSTINFLVRTPNVLRLAIPNLNTTAIGHPLLSGQSILVSVKLTYTPVGAAQRSVSYPKNYTDSVAAAAWTQKAYTGIESTSSASASFSTYAIYPAPENAPPRPLLDSIMSLLPTIGLVAAFIAMGFGFVALSQRRKRSRGYPTSTPQQH